MKFSRKLLCCSKPKLKLFRKEKYVVKSSQILLVSLSLPVIISNKISHFSISSSFMNFPLKFFIKWRSLSHDKYIGKSSVWERLLEI